MYKLGIFLYLWQFNYQNVIWLFSFSWCICSFQPKPDKRDEPRTYKYSGEKHYFIVSPSPLICYWDLFVIGTCLGTGLDNIWVLYLKWWWIFQPNPFMNIKNSVMDKDKDSLAKKFLNGRSGFYRVENEIGK